MRFLLVFSFLLGLVHGFIPHDHDDHGSDHLNQEVVLSQCSHGSDPKDFLNHLLDAFTEMDHLSAGEDFSFTAPDTENLDTQEILYCDNDEGFRLIPQLLEMDSETKGFAEFRSGFSKSDQFISVAPSRGSPIV